MNLKQSIKEIIETTNTTGGRIFAWAIQALIIVSLIEFSIETLPNLSETTRQYLAIAEMVAVLIFTVEYCLRVYVADNKLRYIFSFYGIFDLLAILPFYLSLEIDLRSLRIFRLFRLVRIFKLVRYNSAIMRFKNAFTSVREELVLAFVAAAFVLYLSSVGIYYFESQEQPEKFGSIFHCMWWAIVTLTTVGYGDTYPITTGGKIFTGCLMIVGLGVVAVPTALFASALTVLEGEELKREQAESE